MSGYRSGTRYMFARDFRKHGALPSQVYLRTYKRGDIVDIKAVGNIHKGMPHKIYHGRTGVIFDVTPHAVGVEVNKPVRNRIIKKRIHVRIEHVKPSKCRDDFLKRVKLNAEIKRKYKETKNPKGILKNIYDWLDLKPVKRVVKGPHDGYYVKAQKLPLFLQPFPYDTLC